MSVQFSGLHLYRSVIVLSIWVFWDHTYINRLFSLLVQFLGPHLYWLVIYLVSSVFRTVPISIGHHLVRLSLSFLGPHLYRSFILSVWVWVYFWTTLISIGHSFCQFEFECFLGLHIYRSIIVLSIWVWVWVFWDRTYINWSSSCQFEFEFEFFRTAPISISYRLVSWVEFFGIASISIDYSSFLSVWVFGPHLYRSIIFHVSLSSWDHTYIDRSSSMLVWV